MPTLRNVSGLGDLDVDGVGFVESGATFDVDDDTAERLLRQAENFEQVGASPVAPEPTPAAPVVDEPAPAEES
jgi:hypothetical protein